MINASRRLREFEARYQREAYADRTYADALARFAALWAEARTLNPELGADWLHDVKADIAIARALNGLPPSA